MLGQRSLPITPDGSGYDFVLEASASWEPRAARTR